MSFPNAFHGLVQTFAGYSPDFVCLDGRHNQTSSRVVDFDDQANSCNAFDSSDECTDFLFDRAQFQSTVVTEWNLVCARKYLTELDTSAFMAGKLVGALVLGVVSDLVGRRKVFFISILLLLLSGCMAYVAPWFWVYLLARLLAGVANSGTTLAGYILALELVDPAHRPIPGLIWHFVNAIGNIVLLGFAYYIREWRMLMLAITLPSIIFLLYWRHLPESPRWLLLQGRIDEAEIIVSRAARVNGRPDLKVNFDELKAEKREKPSLTGELKLLFRSWYLMRSTIIIWACWMCLSGAYYGLSLNTKYMSGNIYMNFMYVTLVELPAILILIPLAKLMSRRLLLGSLMVCGGLSCLLVLILPLWANVISFFGKFFVSGALALSYLISVELFPTSVRNIGLGVSSVASRIGGILCPFVLVTKDWWEPAPYVIFGGSTLVVGAMTFFLRGTECELAETTEETKKKTKVPEERDLLQ